MFSKILKFCFTYIKSNLALIIIVTFIIISGIASGSYSVSAVAAQQKDNLINHINLFVSKIDTESINNYEIFRISLLNNLKFVTIIYILGLTLIGIPIILIIVFIKGYILGFTVGFLIESLEFKGFMISALSVFPQNMVLIPMIIFLSCSSISFTTILLKDKKNGIMIYLLNYGIVALICLILTIIGSFIEAFISPVFIHILIPYF